MLGRVKQRFIDLSLRGKMLLIVLAAQLLVMIPGTFIAGRMLYENQVEELYRAMDSGIRSSAQTIVRELEVANSYSGTFLADATLQAELSRLHGTDSMSVRGDVYHTLQSLLQFFLWDANTGHVRGIRIDTDEFSVEAYTNQGRSVSEEAIREILPLAREADGRLVVCTSDKEENTVFITRVVREVKHFSLDHLGVLTIFINMEQMMNEAAAPGGEAVTADCRITQNGAVLYRSGLMASPGADELLEQLRGGYGVVKADGHRYFCATVHLDDYGWDFTCLRSFDSAHARVTSVYLVSGALVVLTIVLSAALWLLMTHRLARHIDGLLKKMRAFSGNRMERPGASEEYASRHDEIGMLHRQFDAMADDIIDLVQENYVQELLTRDAQLRALEMQMNPHFLYNVLDSINWRAQAAGAGEISQMVEALGSLLRVALERGSREHSLGSEVALVGHYIAIQRIRYEERLIYREELDENVREAVLPKMVLQPLVENAVRYGLENSLEEEVVITLTTRAEGDHLVMTVKNTGSQFEDELLARLRGGDIRPGGYGIGVLNIEDRLRLTYGEEHPLTLYNEDGCAVARICIPLRFAAKEETAC